MPWKEIGSGDILFLLKSTTIPFVLQVLSKKWFSSYHVAKLPTINLTLMFLFADAIHFHRVVTIFLKMTWFWAALKARRVEVKEEQKQNRSLEGSCPAHTHVLGTAGKANKLWPHGEIIQEPVHHAITDLYWLSWALRQQSGLMVLNALEKLKNMIHTALSFGGVGYVIQVQKWHHPHLCDKQTLADLGNLQVKP